MIACTQQCLLCFFVFIDLAAAEGKFISIHLVPCVFEDVEDFVVLVLGDVAIGEEAADLFGIFLGEETFGEEGGIGGDLVLEGFVDGFD